MTDVEFRELYARGKGILGPRMNGKIDKDRLLAVLQKSNLIWDVNGILRLTEYKVTKRTVQLWIASWSETPHPTQPNMATCLIVRKLRSYYVKFIPIAGLD